MESFWGDVAVAAIGAAFGAVFTIFVGYLTYRWETSRRERDAVISLIDDLHSRRAFLPISSPREVERATQEDDCRFATSSVKSARDVAKATRQALRGGSLMRRDIDTIIRACNGYLEGTMVDANRYQFLLAELRNELFSCVRALAEKRRGIEPLVPGGGSL